jgi:hypothetical protein
MIFKGDVAQAHGRVGTFTPGFGCTISDAVQVVSIKWRHDHCSYANCTVSLSPLRDSLKHNILPFSDEVSRSLHLATKSPEGVLALICGKKCRRFHTSLVAVVFRQAVFHHGEGIPKSCVPPSYQKSPAR